MRHARGRKVHVPQVNEQIIVRNAELAARIAADKGERQKANAAWKLVRRLWVAVGREEEAERISRRLADG